MLKKRSFHYGSFLMLLFVTAFSNNVWAKPHTPAPGSSERKAIMNAFRVPIQREAKQQVVFYQVLLRVESGWAYVSAIAKDKTGTKLVVGDAASLGLLHREGGRWVVKHWGIASDVSVTCYMAKNFPRAPRAIFGGVLSAC